MFSLGTRKKSFTASDGSVFAGSRGYGSTLSFFKGLSFDNTYPSITKIANEFMTLRPYAIDANGKPIENAPVLDKLYHPNQQMSSADFREALAVMALVHRKVYLLMWHNDGSIAVPGGPITEKTLAGFTFLEGVSEVVVDNKKTYRSGTDVYDTDDVIEIYAGVDPYDLSKGYSPSIAADKWANLDDYIAAYNAGLFENGAVPSGQFIVTAASSDQFNDIVDEMQRKHRGSGRNNNVVYTHRPISPTTGAPVDAQIEWIPFAQTNKEMDLATIFQQANDKIDSAFGVPASIRGVNDNNTYASVRVDEQIFIKYAVVPFATKIWTRFTHEMNRVTGGLGYAITFEADVPGIADEEKVEAEKKLTEFNLIKQAMDSGFNLDSVVDAFELSVGYKLLKDGYVKPVIHNDKPEVDEGDEVEDAPDSTSKYIKSKHVASELHSGVSCSCSEKVAEPEDAGIVEDVAKIVRQSMQKQIDNAIERLENVEKASESAEDEDLKAMVTAILAVLTAYILIKGSITYKEGIAMITSAGLPVTGATEFYVNQLTSIKYRVYLTKVAQSYTDDTAQRIRDILSQGATMGWNKEQIANELRGIMGVDEWRVQRLARTEEHRAFSQSGVDAMRQLKDETGADIVKKWKHSGVDVPCEYCAAMEGTVADVDELFLPVGAVVEGVDGGLFENTFYDIDSGGLHPNCHCSARDFEIRGKE